MQFNVANTMKSYNSHTVTDKVITKIIIIMSNMNEVDQLKLFAP